MIWAKWFVNLLPKILRIRTDVVANHRCLQFYNHWFMFLRLNFHATQRAEFPFSILMFGQTICVLNEIMMKLDWVWFKSDAGFRPRFRRLSSTGYDPWQKCCAERAHSFIEGGRGVIFGCHHRVIAVNVKDNRMNVNRRRCVHLKHPNKCVYKMVFLSCQSYISCEAAFFGWFQNMYIASEVTVAVVAVPLHSCDE